MIVSRDTTILARMDFYGGGLEVTTSPPQANVFSGRWQIIAMLKSDTFQPFRSIKIVAEGYEPVEEKVPTDVGKVVERRYSLVKVCTVSVTSTPPGEQVLMDNESLGACLFVTR
jgi:hypothetical protein